MSMHSLEVKMGREARTYGRSHFPEEKQTVTRNELSDAVCEALSLKYPNFTRADARRALDEVLDEITDGLTRGEAVRLRSFGTFRVLRKRARVGRNPKTKIEAPICARRVVSFKASAHLVDHMNKQSEKKAPARPASRSVA